MVITHMETSLRGSGISIRETAPLWGEIGMRNFLDNIPPSARKHPYEFPYQQEPWRNRNYSQEWNFPRSDQNQQRPIEWREESEGAEIKGTKGKKSVVGQDIYNLSSANLFSEEISLLDKGLKFAPPQKLNKFQTYMDIHKYTRKLSVKRYIMTNPIQSSGACSTDIQLSN